MRGRSAFGPGAYVVRYAWWGPAVPAVLGAVIIAGFVVGVAAHPPVLHLRPGPHLNPWGWTKYGAQWVMPLVGVGLVFAGVAMRGTQVAAGVRAGRALACVHRRPASGRGWARRRRR